MKYQKWYLILGTMSSSLSSSNIVFIQMHSYYYSCVKMNNNEWKIYASGENETQKKNPFTIFFKSTLVCIMHAYREF